MNAPYKRGIGFLLCLVVHLAMKSSALAESNRLPGPDQPYAGWQEYHHQDADSRILMINGVLAPCAAGMVYKRIYGPQSIDDPAYPRAAYYAVQTCGVADQMHYMRL